MQPAIPIINTLVRATPPTSDSVTALKKKVGSLNLRPLELVPEFGFKLLVPFLQNATMLLSPC